MSAIYAIERELNKQFKDAKHRHLFLNRSGERMSDEETREHKNKRTARRKSRIAKLKSERAWTASAHSLESEGHILASVARENQRFIWNQNRSNNG